MVSTDTGASYCDFSVSKPVPLAVCEARHPAKFTISCGKFHVSRGISHENWPSRSSSLSHFGRANPLKRRGLLAYGASAP